MSVGSQRASWRIVLVASLAFGSGPVGAEEEEGSVPGAIPDPSTYQGSMELQRREQEQEQSYQPQPSFGAPGEQNQSAYPGGSSVGRANAGPTASPGDIWRRRPPLPPEANRLLGRWHPLGAVAAADGGVSNVLGQDFANAIASVAGSVLGGACDSMFGRGVIEFAPDALLAVGADGGASVLNHVQYRGDGDAVAVLPTDPGSVDVIVFDVVGERITARALGCTMERVRSSASATSTRADVASRSPGSNAIAPTNAAQLSLLAAVAPPSGDSIPITGAQVFLQRRAIEASLSGAGFAEVGRTPVQSWATACKSSADACRAGVRAMMADPVAVVKTDAGGRLTMPPVSPGHYYLFAFVNVRGRAFLWNVPVDLRPGGNALVLDEHNAIAPL